MIGPRFRYTVGKYLYFTERAKSRFSSSRLRTEIEPPTDSKLSVQMNSIGSPAGCRGWG